MYPILRLVKKNLLSITWKIDRVPAVGHYDTFNEQNLSPLPSRARSYGETACTSICTHVATERTEDELRTRSTSGLSLNSHYEGMQKVYDGMGLFSKGVS